MKGSLRLGQAFGIGIFVHWSFGLILAWVLLSSASLGLGGMMGGLLLTLAVFGLVVLHELGHSLAARHYGIGTRHITLLPIGGVAALERMPTKPREEMVIALAGPAVNVVLALLLLPLVFLSGLVSVALSQWLLQLVFVNAVLAIFNLLPAFPMDGGRVLRAWLARRQPYVEATRKAAKVGQCLAVVLALVGLFTMQWTLLLIGGFIFFAAGAERLQVTMQHRFGGFQQTPENRPTNGPVIDADWELLPPRPGR
ncbi:MAG: site-2 protease family protein [Verrucomicrobiota bacterium]